jgi:hypothetical protein
MAWGPAWVDSGKMFSREDGSALHPATVTDRFQAISQAAELPPIRLHDLCHGAAGYQYRGGGADEGRSGDARTLNERAHG